MTKPLLAALAFVLMLVAPAAAQTQRYQLTDQAWVDLGAAPYTVRTLGNPAAIVIDTAPPSSLSAPFTVLGSDVQTGMPVTVTGTHAYARALNGQTAVATFPASAGSSGGGGGGGGAITPTPGAQEQDVRSTQTLNAATANAAITVPINGQGVLGFAISGLTASGATLTFEQSEDGGTTWTVVNEVNAGTGVPTSTRTTDGQSRIAASGRTNIRFRVSTTGTGTITIAYSVSVREGMVALTAPIPPGANVIGNVLTGQYNATLPTLATGAYGPLAVDANGRQLLAPTSTINVLNTGTFAVQNTAATPAGTNSIGTVGLNAGTNQIGTIGNTAFGISGTLPAYAATPTFNIGTLGGAATAANQNSTAAGTSAANAQGVQGVTGGVPLPVSGSFYQATQPISAASLPLPTGAATAANQVTMAANQNATAAGTSATSAQGVQGVTGGVPLTNVAQDTSVPAGSPFSASSAIVLFSIDTSGYQSVAIQLSGTWAATITYEESNDNSNWYTKTGYATNATSISSTDTTNQLRAFPVSARYFRARVSSYTSGTIVAAPSQRSTPFSSPIINSAITNGITATLAASTNSFGSLGVTSTANGLANFSRLPSSVASTNLTQAKATAGRLYKVVACNTTTTSARIKFYNATSANVTVGTTTPLLTRPIPAAAAAGGLACASYDWSDIGAYFGTAISWAITTGAADNDATAVAAAAITDVSVEYQ